MKLREQVVQNWDLLDRMAQKRFQDTNLAHEALLFALESFKANDWRKIKAFKRKSNFKTYLTSLTSRALEDFARKKFGRVRPPQWIKSSGPLWMVLFRLLCLERMSIDDALETIRDSAPGGRSFKIIEEAAFDIKSRIVDCGHQRGHSQAADHETLDSLTRPESSMRTKSPEQKVDEQQQNSFFQIIFQELIDSDRTNHRTTGNHTKSLEKFRQRLNKHLNLTPEDRLLLKMIYQDGIKVGEAGRMFGLNQNQSYGRQKRLLLRIRAAFDASGFRDELRGFLD